VQPEFWRARWRTGQIGFHQSAPDRHLAEFWPRLKLPPDSSVFVPLCGKSLDLLWLRDNGHSVSGVELSAIALESFCMENGILTRRRILADFERYEAAGLELFCGDYFSLNSGILGAIDAVYDRAALISWTPQMRLAYVKQATALVRRGAQILLVTLEYPPEQMAGPPFPVTSEEVRRLYAKDFAIQQLDRQDILAAEPRLRSRGLTLLHEVCYRLTRL
jgi:thiopurine S-methyltransferase